MDDKPFPEIVQVIWKDSYGVFDTWHDITEYQPELRVLSTSGYLVHEDDEYITVATTFDKDAQVFSTAIAILKNCILSRKSYIA